MRRRRPVAAAVAVAASCGLLTAATVLPLLRPAPVSAAAGKAAARRDDDPVVDTVADGKGRINYAAGVIKATGNGALPDTAVNPGQAKLMALGAAKADALRNLAMAVSSVRVTGDTTVRNYVLQNDTVRTSVDALLQNPRVVSEKVNADGTATVVVELPMYGKESLAAVVMPEVIKRDDDAPVAPPAVVDVPGTKDGVWKGPDKPAIRVTPRRPAPIPPLNGPEPGLTSRSDSGPFSSVLIDCRGLDVEAVMSPKLYDTNGREVYGTVRVSADYAIEVGIVGYPRSMAEALRTKRCGAHPLIVRAVGVQDKFRFNPVISAEDADRILDANSRDRFLEKTAVVFLVDPIKFRKW
jgi:hypothetical protein